MENNTTSPALKTFCVWADRRFFTQVEATSPEEAYREAQKWPGDFEPCSHGIENFEMVAEVMELDSGETFPIREADGDSSPADTPWIAEPSDGFYRGFYRVVNSKSAVIAEGCVEEEAELFAAAPKLLTELRAADEIIQTLYRKLIAVGGTEELPPLRTDYRISAIAKAEGR